MKRGAGFKVAAIVGFLLSIAIGLGFYAMTTLPISVMSYIDPFIWAIYFGIGGAAIGWSLDGIHFEARPEPLARTYMRTLQHEGYTYAMSMPGQFYRSRDPLGGFEEGPRLFNPNMRHAALLKRGETRDPPLE